MQALLDSFGPWLAKNKQDNLSSAELRRYEQQYEIYSEILQLCQCTDFHQEQGGRVCLNTATAITNGES